MQKILFSVLLLALAFGHFLLPAGDTLLGRFFYLLGGRRI